MPNLVVNPGAENSFSFWSPRVDSAQKGWVDGGVNSHTGARNFITLSTSLCTMNQTITSFVPNTNYTVSLWIKLINTGSGYVNLRINNETLISSTDFTTNYKQFYATAPYVPSSSNEVLSISGYTSAFLIIDDISVDGLVPPTSSPTTKPSTIPTIAPTAIITVSPTKTPTLAPTIQPSKHPSSQPTAQPSAQPSSSPSSQPTVQPSKHPSGQPSPQPTAQPSAQPSSSPSSQPTVQPSKQPSGQPRPQPTAQPSAQPSSSPSSQPTVQPSEQPSSQPSNQPTAQPTEQPSSNPSSQPTVQPSEQPSSQPSNQPTAQPSEQPSSSPSSQPTVQPSKQPSGQPSSQPTAQPSAQPSGQPSSQPTVQPSEQPSSQPSNQPTVQPSEQPSGQPSNQPTAQPTEQPSSSPSSQPTTRPSAQPSSSPSSQPTVQPSEQPSSQPSNQPTAQPTEQPSSSPSSQPTVQPSEQPSSQPSNQPTAQPSAQPSSSPSSQPTVQPSEQPSGQPSPQPTAQPSAQPSSNPSSQPTVQPSEQPSAWPSEQPNAQPSSSPTIRTEPPTKAPTISSGTLENNMSVSILGTTSSFKIVSNKFTLSNLLPLSDISINNANSATNYVLFGSATLKNIDVTGLIPSQGFSVSPAISYSSNSNSVSNIGDINQDGYDDLIIAPPSNDIIASVLFGTRDGFINMKEGFTIFGGNNNDGIPQSSVSSAGDFNNDGYPDIILGLPYEKYNGIAYVILGKKSGFTNIYLNKLDYTQGFSISASGARYFGSSVSSAGDVNGDGFDDLIISSSSSTNPDNYAHVVFGNKNIINLYLVGNLNINLGFRITIKEPYTIINGVSKIGDVNKDGYDDVLLSTAIFKGELIDVSYLIYGGRFLGGREIFVSSTGVAATQGIVIKGAGIVASYIGDINNDGYNDFMLGSGYSLSEPGYVVFTPDKFTVSPSTSPTIAPTLYHSPSPTIIPSLAPSLKPSMKPSPIPSTQPTSQPTSPTASPTIEPTNPTGEPTSQPSNPTHKPTSIPTAPTVAPTVILTPKPTIIPSAIPTCTPTISPSIEPTKSPSSIPTKAPTISPTIIPTDLPSLALTTTHPSQDPTAEPSSSASVSMGIGTILGIAFGGITGVAAIIAGGYYCIKHYIFNNKIDPVNNINQAVNIDYKSQSDQVLSQLENGELKHQGSAKLSDLRPSSDTLADKKNSESLDFMNYNNFGGLGGSLSSATFAPLNRGACLDTDSIQENTLLKPYIPIINNIIDDEDFSISSMSDLESIKEDSQSLEDNIKVSEIDEESTISGELSPDQYEI